MRESKYRYKQLVSQLRPFPSTCVATSDPFSGTTGFNQSLLYCSCESTFGSPSCHSNPRGPHLAQRIPLSLIPPQKRRTQRRQYVGEAKKCNHGVFCVDHSISISISSSRRTHFRRDTTGGAKSVLYDSLSVHFTSGDCSRFQKLCAIGESVFPMWSALHQGDSIGNNAL